jgi:hypothetical protein
MNFTPFAYFEKTPQVTFIGVSFSNASQASYTFTGVNFGSSGLCAITIGNEISGAVGRTVNSITLNGVTMSQAVQQISGLNSTGVGSAIYYLRKSETTGTVVITFSAAPQRCLIGIYSITDNSSDVPYQTRSNTNNSGTGLSQSYTSLEQDSVGILHYTVGLHTVTGLGWTNATQTFNLGDGIYGQTRYSGANFLTTSAGSRTIGVTHSNSTQPSSLVGAVWN